MDIIFPEICFNVGDFKWIPFQVNKYIILNNSEKTGTWQMGAPKITYL